MLQAFKIPIGWFELGKRTLNEAIEDDVSGLAAELAYYFFLALFPALLFLVALASFFPVHDLMTQIVGALSRFAPGEVLTIVRNQISTIAGDKNGGLLTVGFLGTVWSTSSAMSGIISTLNKAYEITDSRPWWKVKLIAIGLTFGVGVFILMSFALVLVGPRLAEPMAGWLGLGHAFAVTWRIVQWPIVFLLVSVAIGLVYYFGPDAEQQWEWITPGSLVATLLWILVSLGFRFYVTAFGNFNATYGAIGGVIVAMLWMYISGLAMLIGAELNAEIEHASPWGKKKGEKRPGEKTKIGRLAAAAFEESGELDVPALEPRLPPPDRQLPAPAGPPRRRASDRVRLSDWALGGAAIVAELALAIRTMKNRVKG